MVVLFAIWLPVASTIAAAGLKPSRMVRSLRVLKHIGYWGWLISLILVGVYVPYKLIWWIPDLATLTRQAWSAGARLLLAYVLLISAWIGLLLVTGTHVDQEDPQPSGGSSTAPA
jgi:hypothetical protein